MADSLGASFSAHQHFTGDSGSCPKAPPAVGVLLAGGKVLVPAETKVTCRRTPKTETSICLSPLEKNIRNDSSSQNDSL